MLIVISGPAQAFELDTEQLVTDPERLKKLDGLLFSKDKCDRYFDAEVKDWGVVGGEIKLTIDDKSKTLRVVTEYAAPRKLNPTELKTLTDYTVGQWSDGIGEGEFLYRKKIKLDVSVFPIEAIGHVTSEQIDDGKVPKTPKRSPLISALEGNKPDKAKALIEKGEPIQCTNEYGYTPLHLACMSRHFELIDLLLARGANAKAEGKNKATPLAHLCMARYDPKLDDQYVHAANQLMKAGAIVDSGDEFNRTPLMWAANRGNLALAKLLVDAGANVNAMYKEGPNEATVLMHVQRIDMAELLLKLGADKSIRTSEGMNARDHALRNSHWMDSQGLATLFE